MNVLILTVLLSLALLGIFLVAFLLERKGSGFKSYEQEALKPLQEDEDKKPISRRKRGAGESFS